MKKFKIEMKALYRWDELEIGDFVFTIEGEARTAYDAVLGCAREFYRLVEQEREVMESLGHESNMVEVQVKSVKEVK